MTIPGEHQTLAIARNYSIKHITRFEYSSPVSESLTEVRMQPLTDGQQTCLSFDLSVNPRVKVSTRTDHLDNTIHHFDIPANHSQLLITVSSTVSVKPFAPLPDQLDSNAWEILDRAIDEHNLYEFLMPGSFTQPSPLLREFAREINATRRAHPLELILEINRAIYEKFEYAPQSTNVDSLIDVALESRRGVCQDYSHIMITLLREFLKVPCRYVSGYLYHRSENHDRSAADATHAWVEVYLPGIGWTGFDPTNDLVAGDRHIRVALGRDYLEVPPTRGVFKGLATSKLSVAVQVAEAEAAETKLRPPNVSSWSTVERPSPAVGLLEAHRQQQQQQQ
jgi:transglutaminase-like putative cysteine protease